MMADISHWFVRRRGLAVVVVASGNYFAGTIWPFLMSLTIPLIGWRATYVGIGVIVAAAVPPLALLMSRRPSAAVFDEADAATQAARADVGISPRLLLALLVLAGFSCCVAMSMPQVHLVAYCGDLGYGVARGAQMLSAMMALGIVSRIGSGFVADSIGGTATLMIGSFMQGLALLLYLFFNGLESLFVVSGIFGLFQGGIVPMYAVICRELLAPRRAGAAIGLVVSATIPRHGVRRLHFRGDIRSHQLLPHGVFEWAHVQCLQFRDRRLALLAPPAAPAGGRSCAGRVARGSGERG
jgi:MFS family permease